MEDAKSAEESKSASDEPCRLIYNDIDMKKFMESSTKKDLLCVITAMGKSCSSSPPLNDGSDSSQYDYNPNEPLIGLSLCMAALHGSLSQIQENWIKDFPPVVSGPGSAGGDGIPMTRAISIRFGNPSFKSWHNRLKHRSHNIVSSILKFQNQKYTQEDESTRLQEAWECGYQAAAAVAKTETDVETDAKMTTKGSDPTITELASYLEDAFGHPIRLDYGTGHESSFMVFLYSLCKLGCLDENSTTNTTGTAQPPSILRLKATTLSIFHQYLQVTRVIQTKYMLEPAGSHGVWGLDDYHCLPFYFGACQLQACKEYNYTSPKCIHEHELINYGDADRGAGGKINPNKKYLFFSCINFIRQLKQGAPFGEHSPMLYDISQTLPSWSKVSGGLLRLYEGEVLNKRQVVQHFKFGKLFPGTWTPSELPRQPPTTNFRPGIGNIANQSNPGALPVTRAPWAK